MPQRVIKSKANAVVASLAKLSRPNENGQRDLRGIGWGRKRKPDTTYVIGWLDLNGHENEEECTNLVRYETRNGSHQPVWI